MTEGDIADNVIAHKHIRRKQSSTNGLSFSHIHENFTYIVELLDINLHTHDISIFNDYHFKSVCLNVERINLNVIQCGV